MAAYTENCHLGLWLTGNNVRNSWAHPDEPNNVFMLEAYVRNILARLGLRLRDLSIQKFNTDIFATAVSVKTAAGKLLAVYGIVTRRLLKDFDISLEVFYADINWSELMKATRSNTVSFKEIAKFPAVKRDLALLLDKEVKFADIEKIAYETDRKLMKNVELFDVYEGKNLDAGKKSYAVTFTIQDEKQTLNDKAIDKLMQKLVKNLQDKLGAKLR